jgi:hypothetical protein
MRRFDYCEEVVAPINATASLKGHGLEGWELKAVVPDQDGKLRLILMREIITTEHLLEASNNLRTSRAPYLNIKNTKG